MSEPIEMGDARTVRPLRGMSGAEVLLWTKDDRHWFVRKVAREPAGNARLQRQMTKQHAFASLLGEIARTPSILNTGEIDGRFYFDMEFVRGSDGVSHLRRASYAEVTAFADRFCAYVDAVAGQPPDRDHGGTLFDALYDKLCEVERKTHAIGDATLVQLFLALERTRRLGITLRPTLCHGDLTLENLIVDDTGNLWLLDLLDAPFEHWWQDVTKISQDLEGGWFLLRQAPISQCVLEYLSRRLKATATSRDPSYSLVHNLLLACTFVRILPYVRTPDEQSFVTRRIEHFARLAGESS